MKKERKSVDQYLALADSSPELATARSRLGNSYIPHDQVLKAMVLILQRMKEDGYERDEVLPSTKSVGSKIVNHFLPPLKALKNKWKGRASEVLDMLQVGRIGSLNIAIAEVYGSGFSRDEIDRVSTAIDEAEKNRTDAEAKAKEESELRRVESLRPENVLREIADEEEEAVYSNVETLDVDSLDTSILDDIE